jgi:hypothetical protein
MVTIYGKRLVRDDLVGLGIGGNAYYVLLIVCTHILMQMNTPLVLTSPPSKLTSAHVQRV